jgi:hypothetical protein
VKDRKMKLKNNIRKENIKKKEKLKKCSIKI